MASDARAAALKVLRKIAEDEELEVVSRVKAAELILKATEPPARRLGWQQQAGSIRAIS